MTLGQVTKRAISYFETHSKYGKREFRGAIPLEFSGNGNEIEGADIRILFSINGDYSMSDQHPYIVCCKCWKDGKIKMTLKEIF